MNESLKFKHAIIDNLLSLTRNIARFAAETDCFSSKEQADPSEQYARKKANVAPDKYDDDDDVGSYTPSNNRFINSQKPMVKNVLPFDRRSVDRVSLPQQISGSSIGRRNFNTQSQKSGIERFKVQPEFTGLVDYSSDYA